ncbi:hypothetical protein GOODEAATRI_006500 [Goodea atripinnis]|uniref:Uncharacterized protein n=1 Tax=Goodea atripinnis TaxID=208336 RepID=A0ABV0PBV0_9TELE
MGLRRADGLESQIIHSGHFMVSSPHSEHPPKKGYDFDTVNKQTCQTYRFGKASTSHLSIDASLTKLFECMTLAYRSCHVTIRLLVVLVSVFNVVCCVKLPDDEQSVHSVPF